MPALPSVLVLFLCLRGSLSCPQGCDCPVGSGVVWCDRRQLMTIPFDIPRDTRILYLDSNWITHVPSGAFRGLTQLRELHLAGNLIETIAPGAFRGLGGALRLLDLSGNQLQALEVAPFVTLAWVKLELYDNPWHCDCSLQELMEALPLDTETVDDVVCATAPWEEYIGKPLAHLLHSGINFCVSQQRNTDLAMLLTMFCWFTVVITYVIYYVRRNQAESRRHLEYLKSLPLPRKQSSPEDEVETDTLSTIL
ncbi:PREDICTED: leucine-rich repeat-containing protein 3-like [Gekko japonicus]|uniref:Leucine-rich repeat-containing protein 3-like n=1 Tax=Gekko japonicus TaxID=146911 RepID=A0ABM1KVH5_GEKJA|nr:PREDICTED: leucine-rich repeat-containing protein 3-like [Gekko japonicus]